MSETTPSTTATPGTTTTPGPTTPTPPPGPPTYRFVEISAQSDQSFEHAIRLAIESVGRDARPNVRSAWVKEQRVEIDGPTFRFQVNVLLSIEAPAGKPLML